MSGWSAVGGLVRNPYALDRIRVRIVERDRRGHRGELRGGGVGTETDGSVVCPSSMNGLVGLKPTLGWSAARMSCRSAIARTRRGRWRAACKDAAILFSAMVGERPGRSRDGARRTSIARIIAAGLSRDRAARACGSRSPPRHARAGKVRFEAARSRCSRRRARCWSTSRGPRPRGMGDAEVRRAQLRTEERSRQISRDDARRR